MKKRLIKVTAAFAVAALMVAGFVVSGNGHSDGSLGTTLESVNADATSGCEGLGVCSLDGIHYGFAPV